MGEKTVEKSFASIFIYLEGIKLTNWSFIFQEYYLIITAPEKKKS